MYRLVVAQARRRQGIATQLVREVEKVFAEWGVRRTTVLIEIDRPEAMKFWTAVGYPRDEHVVRHVGIRADRKGPASDSREHRHDGVPRQGRETSRGSLPIGTASRRADAP